MDAVVDGKNVRFTARSLLGQGGEAEVFDLGDGRVLKRFKPDTHADYAGMPEAQLAAAARLKEHAEKLPALMQLRLPASVIGPQHLAHAKTGLIGYTMRKIDSAVTLADQLALRKSVGGAERNLVLLRALRDVVREVHAAKVVLGDFNDSNVLVRGDEVFCIDADSYQFDRFQCRMFSERFVDPRLCAPTAAGIQLVRPHDVDSDWFAFTVMVMQLLLLVGPFGGVYKPRDPTKRLAPSHRALERISVFHPEVQYPKPAIALSSLPDDLLTFFEDAAMRGRRAPVPLDGLRFTRCLRCGNEHARNVCPFCTQPTAVSHRVAFLGRVRSQSLFRTEGTLVAVASARHWLAHEDGAFVREDKTRVLTGPLSAGLRFALTERRTLVGQNHKLAIFGNGQTQLRSIARGAFATHGEHAVMVSGEALVRLADDAPFAQDETLGAVLETEGHVWLGPSFGLGLYRAGELAVGYTFNPRRKGITDSLRPTCIRGRVSSVGCAIGDFAWLTVVREEAGRRVHTCLMIDPRGVVLASAEDDARNTPWLASAARGAAIGRTLLVPTDAGLARIEASGGALVLTHIFDATEPFVDADCQLLTSASSLLVFDAHELRALEVI